MVIIHLSGGFGNQLYSYAFGYAMAQKRRDSLAIDTAIQDAPWFFRNPDILNLKIVYDKRISYPIGRSIPERALFNKIRFRNQIGWRTELIREGDCQEEDLDVYYEKSRRFSDIYLKGNWGNIGYFKKVQDNLRKMYVFQNSLSPAAEKIRGEINACENSVTIHCRRGDYVKLGICMKADYFIEAMRYMNEKLVHPVFYCFSEEQEWSKKQFAALPYDIRYPEYESKEKGLEDFRLLQAGKHQIIANSSYSWWAAYLNQNKNKMIIAPSGGIFCLDEWLGLPYGTE